MPVFRANSARRMDLRVRLLRETAALWWICRAIGALRPIPRIVFADRTISRLGLVFNGVEGTLRR
jgi:hypothetical protein